MKKTLWLVLIFAILGLIAGYLFFGKIAGEYISLKTIFSSSEGVLGEIGRKVAGIASIKQNILISGGVGAVLGFIIALFKRK